VQRAGREYADVAWRLVSRVRRIAGIFSAKGAENGDLYPRIERVASIPVGSNGIAELVAAVRHR